MRRCGAALAVFLLAAQPAFAEPCPTPPAPVVDLQSNRFYSDRQSSIVDPVLYEKRRAAVKPLEDFRGEIARYASRGFAGKAQWAACAGTWLSSWARGGALLGKMSETQAHYERKWALASFAMAYIRVKPALPLQQRGEIEAWLTKLGEAVDGHYQTHLKNAKNNHYYWLGFALAACDLATGGTRFQDRASRIFNEALAQIQQDGHLPLEVVRGVKALHYHNFSAFPLVMMAEIAGRRGEDWYARNNGALHRLVAITLSGIADNAPMAKLAGTAQERLVLTDAKWLPFYSRRFPARFDRAGEVKSGSFWSNFAGGDLKALADAWVR